MCCLECSDYLERIVRFEEANRVRHALKHPELDDPEFINGRVKKAIVEPTFVYKTIANSKRTANYLYEYTNNGTNIYTKVIIEYRYRVGYVVSAWRIPYVKERGKTAIVYGEHS